MRQFIFTLSVCVFSVSCLAADDRKAPPRSKNMGDTATHEVGHLRGMPSRSTNWSLSSSSPGSTRTSGKTQTRANGIAGATEVAAKDFRARRLVK
ncbi:MAG: hypothetical protein JNJ77_12440 [Planctomycetia bacterium]|nr:hypothetical protein [Planctomycetia bacterium]